MSDKQYLLSLAISRLSFLSFSEKCALQNNLDNIRDLALLSIEDISFIIKRVIKRAVWNSSFVEQVAMADAKRVELCNCTVLRYDSPAYPAVLKEIFDPPYLLFARGNYNILQNNCLGVVGTRSPSQDGRKAAFEFAYLASKADFVIASGLAYGIDACVHDGCLKAGGKTIAVLACGVDSVYPAGNRSLGAKILTNNGCFVSEYAPGEAPQKYRFPQRNRIISGLSSATIVIQAPKKSGALITADFALEQGRDVFIHSAALSLPSASTNDYADVRHYINEGAPVISSFGDFQKTL